jgi:hypothetical protein
VGGTGTVAVLCRVAEGWEARVEVEAEAVDVDVEGVYMALSSPEGGGARRGEEHEALVVRRVKH